MGLLLDDELDEPIILTDILVRLLSHPPTHPST